MAQLSMLQFLKAKLGLLSKAQKDALLQGGRATLSPHSSTLATGTLLCTLALGGGLFYQVKLSREFDRATGAARDSQTLGSGSGNAADGGEHWEILSVQKVDASGVPVRHARTGSQERAELLDAFLSPEARKELQKKHDQWQEKYGDKVYRTQLKPRAVRLAVQAYVNRLVSPGIPKPYLNDFSKSLPIQPMDFSHELTSQDIDRFVSAAESDYLEDHRSGH